MTQNNGNLTQLMRQGKMSQRQLEVQLKKRYGVRQGKIKTLKLLNPRKLGPEWD